MTLKSVVAGTLIWCYANACVAEGGYLGAAVGSMFAEHLGVQADATRVDSSIQCWNLGLVYRF